MNTLNPWKTILTGMVFVLIGVFLLVSSAAPALARLLIGSGVLAEVSGLVVFLLNELRRLW